LRNRVRFGGLTSISYNPCVREVVFASGNKEKLDEFREIIRQAELEIAVRAPAELGIDVEVEETGESFEENARIKAVEIARAIYVGMTPLAAGDRAAARARGILVIAEDSGLTIDALDGWPGVHSKRVASSDPERIALVLERLAECGIGTSPDSTGDAADLRRTARFVCAAAVADRSGVIFESRGEVEGLIAKMPSGEGGFGYDPIFFYAPENRTFAEMTRSEKSRVSHRRRALEKVCAWLEVDSLG